MASAPQSEEIELLVSYNAICERQRHALRLFAGRGKRFSTEELSLGSGVKEKRVHAAIRPVSADDYRLLFGSGPAITERPTHLNNQIPDPRNVPGLKDYIYNSYR